MPGGEIIGIAADVGGNWPGGRGAAGWYMRDSTNPNPVVNQSLPPNLTVVSTPNEPRFDSNDANPKWLSLPPGNGSATPPRTLSSWVRSGNPSVFVFELSDSTPLLVAQYSYAVDATTWTYSITNADGSVVYATASSVQPVGPGVWTYARIWGPGQVRIATGAVRVQGFLFDPDATPATSPVVQATATSFSATLGISATVNMPSGVASGDLLVVSLSITANRTITAPPGWTLYRDDLDGLSVHRLATYYRVSGGSEPSSYTWAFSGSVTFVATAIRISGVDGAAPVNASNFSVATNNSTSPSATTAVAGCLVVRVASVGRGRTFTEPAGHVERSDVGDGVACSHATATVVQARAGATGTAAWAVGGGSADRSIHHVLAFAPGGGSPGVPGRLLCFEPGSVGLIG